MSYVDSNAVACDCKSSNSYYKKFPTFDLKAWFFLSVTVVGFIEIKNMSDCPTIKKKNKVIGFLLHFFPDRVTDTFFNLQRRNIYSINNEYLFPLNICSYVKINNWIGHQALPVQPLPILALDSF